MRLEIRDLVFSYDKKEILHSISLSASDGDIIALLGPNGVGKSTFFRCLLGFLRPSHGGVMIDGKNIRSLSQTEVAKQIAYIPQSASPAFNYTVLDSVLMGVTNQLGMFSSPTEEQRETAMKVLTDLGIGDLAYHGCNRISGGERQLMLLARSLLQKAKILVMDEPTANLDYGNSYRVMEKIRELGSQGYTVIFSTHEPNQAFRFANRVVAFKDGSVLAEGDPNIVLTEETLSKLYGIGVAVRQVEAGSLKFNLSIPM